MKKVFISDLKEGMIVGKDTFTSSGILIVPAGVTVTESIIEHLMSLGLTDVVIDEDAVNKNELKFEKHKLAEFNKKYTAARDNLDNTFGKVLEGSLIKDDVEELVNASWNMMDENINTYEMLGMIYSMHQYSDATYMHCMNVGVIATMIGKWLDWKEEDLKILNACGMFHDIGKLMIDKAILDKPSRLTDEEYKIMKTHTVKGYELLKPMGLDKRIVNAALLHHERCDGSGYPLGVKGDKLDEFTKIIAIADVYEALTANRVYRRSMCPFDAIAHFEKDGFGIYDTRILLVFIHNMLNSYLNSQVRLSNGEEAEIVLINKQEGSKPVLITSSGRTVDLSKEKDIKITEII